MPTVHPNEASHAHALGKPASAQVKLGRADAAAVSGPIRPDPSALGAQGSYARLRPSTGHGGILDGAALTAAVDGNPAHRREPGLAHQQYRPCRHHWIGLCHTR